MLDLALIEACAAHVAVETVQAIVRVESGGDPLALNANRNGTAVRLRADELTEAIALARAEIAAGHTVDIGLMQINSANLPRLGISIEQAFVPCTNLRAGAQILGDAYARAIEQHGEGQGALQAALSTYNTGNPTRGFRNGYVARYYAERTTPDRASLARVYSANPTVNVWPYQEPIMYSTPNETTQPIVTGDPRDLLTPGVQVEFTPDEADAHGLVIEDALSEHDAWIANFDLAEQQAGSDGR